MTAICQGDSGLGSEESSTEYQRNRMMTIRFSIRWLIVAYGLFVWFQLVPTFLLNNFIVMILPAKVSQIVVLGLTWMFVIALVVGHRSSAKAVWETTAGSILYTLTMLMVFERFWLAPTGKAPATQIVGLILLVGALMFAGSWLGGQIFQRSLRQRAKTVSP